MGKYLMRMITFIIMLSGVTYIYGGPLPANRQDTFQQISKDYIEEIDSELITYTHTSSGAYVIHIKNQDLNKAFAIGFKTPIHDNTGVNHIIEHAVFTGSEKYNVKDVFFEMKKGSPNIFMNASTAADMTIYPFSTRNDQDYNNLLDVYLDAVFFPNLQKHPYGFDQEGWHYSIDQEDNLQVSGVVYNEMKGASVAPRRILAMANRAAMFPDTMYIYNAGGNPNEISNLSYDQFKQTHKDYYIPSNSCAFIYGDVDIKVILDKLDHYYNQFKKGPEQDISQKQAPFKKPQYHTQYYPSVKQRANYYMSTNFAVGEIDNIKLQLSMRILMDMLTQYEQSPLREVFRKNQISKTLSYDVDSAIPQPMYSIVATDIKKEDIKMVEPLIKETIAKIAKDGFDQDLIKMAINSYQINTKQRISDISKGVDMGYKAIYGWGHGVDPLKILQEQALIEQIKEEGDSGYFQELVQTYLLDNPHSSQVLLAPDDRYISKAQEDEIRKLKQEAANQTTEKRQALIKSKEDLKQWQQQKDHTNSLPKLNLKDINSASKLPSLRVKESKQNKSMYYIADTNDLIYMDLYFDTAYIPQESLNELFLFSHLIGQKEKNSIALYTGGMTCSSIAIPKFECYNEYRPKLKLSLCSPKENIQMAFQIIDQITHNSTWDEQWLLTQIQKIQRQYEDYFTSNPLELVSQATGNSQSGASRYDYEKTLPFYQYICEVEKNYDQYKNQIIEKLTIINKSIFNKESLVLGASLQEANIKILEKNYKKYTKKLHHGNYPENKYDFNKKEKRQGFPIASDVQYIVWAGNYKESGGAYDGSLYVLANLLNAEYMLENIRVQNGAYGAGIKFNPYGNMDIYTYQDPKLLESFKTIENMPNYIKQLKIDPNLLEEHKIGAFAKFERELGLNEHPAATGQILQQYYLSGLSNERLEKVKQEIFETTLADLKGQAKILDHLIKQRRYSVAASEGKLLTNIKHFDIIQAFQSIK